MEQRVDPKIGVVIVAAGSGSRMGGELPKQFRFLGQLPLLAHSINRFAGCYERAEIVVVLSADRVEYWNNLVARLPVANHRVVIGGSERFHSVKSGIDSLSEGVDIIAVHDAARPFTSTELIKRCVTGATADGSAIPTVAVKDSIRQIDGDTASIALDRSSLRAVQTPQCFDAVVLRRAYRLPYSPLFTDDASVVESSGERVWLCEGEHINFKITTDEDMVVAQTILKQLQ
ncbi:MAG: 2-C-methyl-D-erythritol 4-phosphate cytidylyltransferase [Rikenellaceae bacterium]